MAINDLDILHSELPEVFEKGPIPPDLEKDWIIIGVDSPEKISDDLKKPEETEDLLPPSLERLRNKSNGPWLPNIPKVFPGGPMSSWDPDFFPPPDALAFYLPFHFYYSIWWGIYLTYEGIEWLTHFIMEKESNMLDWKDALLATQIFLYGHEVYHHKVECFATRLEVSHRVPLYKTSFFKYYKKSIQSPVPRDDFYWPNEEALACAYGFLKVKNIFREDKAKQKAVARALKSYIKDCPPCYGQALEYINPKDFKLGQCDFAEKNHHISFNKPQKNSSIWLVSPHAFSGIGRITSRVNFIVHRESPIFLRRRLHMRYIRYPDLRRKLEKISRCVFVCHGKRHEIWKSPKGNTFTIPRHPGDINRGLLRDIIRQAGLNMSVTEFLQA